MQGNRRQFFTTQCFLFPNRTGKNSGRTEKARSRSQQYVLTLSVHIIMDTTLQNKEGAEERAEEAGDGAEGKTTETKNTISFTNS